MSEKTNSTGKQVVKPEFKLDAVSEVDLAQIVKQFQSVQVGARFYRSCKAARNFVDLIKPAWPLDDMLLYSNNKREKISERRTPFFTNVSISACPGLQLEFLRIKKSNYLSANDFIKNVVIPDVATIGAIDTLQVNGDESGVLSEEELKQLVTVAKADTVCLNAHFYDATSDALKNVKHLSLVLTKEESLSYWGTKRIFKLMRTKRTLYLEESRFRKDVMVTFFKNWLGGEPTGSFEKMIYEPSHVKEKLPRYVAEVLNHKDVQRLVKSCHKQPDGFILEREGGELLRITHCPDGVIEFHFY